MYTDSHICIYISHLLFKMAAKRHAQNTNGSGCPVKNVVCSLLGRLAARCGVGKRRRAHFLPAH